MALLQVKYERLLSAPWSVTLAPSANGEPSGTGADADAGNINSPVAIRARLNHLRRLVLLDGLPRSAPQSLRSRLWTVLLCDSDRPSAAAYSALIARGPSSVHSKICNDAFRTFRGDADFGDRVPEASLVRVLSAYAHTVADRRPGMVGSGPDAFSLSSTSPSSSASGFSSPDEGAGRGFGGPARSHRRSRSSNILLLQSDAEPTVPSPELLPTALQVGSPRLTAAGSPRTSPYVQGMNVLLAPILYITMPGEVDAFGLYRLLCSYYIPMYLVPSLDGVHMGCQIIDECLSFFDPELAAFFNSKNMPASLYSFPWVLTLSGAAKPLSEVLRLWDFLFAFGPHLNILIIVARLLQIRNALLSSPSPMRVFRNMPDLNAGHAISLTLQLVKSLPPGLFDRLNRHTWDSSLYTAAAGWTGPQSTPDHMPSTPLGMGTSSNYNTSESADEF
ncbi:hypothetical protein H696_00504 [Fonticula alba]|uniref:Rab-GAP TBC domain-containing protein n=1 Tax=Fonticula alba TaxID=691883 RepID=A0A058ZEV9_FONAL|nr:hypothetical protein H696_00504 [Fonticula alba]KCV72950.1 hypothetical protein H696_00504 [Fonticula alba]|eukprot:XP_009492651.1 hypothetical protein H696_00504 [Fonticula alba]